MAGYYPDAPDLKLYWNDDGTLAFIQAGTGGPVSATTGNALNGESSSNQITLSQSNMRFGLLFPNLYDIKGLFVLVDSATNLSNGLVRTSNDTTNGMDGTWTERTTTFPIAGGGANNASTAWRTAVQSVSYTGVKALTVAGNTTYRQLHVYGKPSAGTNVDRLRFWHSTNDTEIGPAHFDYGDQQRLVSKTVQFRVKNNSATKTANTITVRSDAITNASPTLPSQTTFSTDGSTFSSQVTIASLAPQATSSVLYAKLALTGTAALGPYRERFLAIATTWA
jgi:hypothetical protein